MNARYLHTGVGKALVEVLQDMTTTGELTNDLATSVVREFNAAFDRELQNIRTGKKVALEGSLESYTNAQEEWLLRIHDAHVQPSGRRRVQGDAAVDVPCLVVAGSDGAARSKRK